MTKEPYLQEKNIEHWTEDLLRLLAGRRGRTRLPVLDATTALIWLDPQKIFVSEESPAFLPSWRAIRNNCFLLVDLARRRGATTIVTRHVHPPEDNGGSLKHFFGRLIRGEDHLSALINEVDQWFQEGFRIVEKKRHSAFSNPETESLLRRERIETVLIIGVQAHLCVLATAVEAATRDFLPVVVADAIAAGSEREHRSSIEVLSGGMAGVMTTREVLERWR